MSDTIVDVVERSSHLQEVVRQLLECGYLSPGVFHPKAYLIDQARIEAMWRGDGEDINEFGSLGTIAVGVAIYNKFFYEITAKALTQQEPEPDSETLEWLSEWKEFLSERFFGDHSMEEDARAIGQYLEFRNRKAQGF